MNSAFCLQFTVLIREQFSWIAGCELDFVQVRVLS